MKNIISAIIMFSLAINAFSQGMDIKNSERSWFIGFSVCPGTSSLKYSNTNNISDQLGLSFQSSFEAGKYFNKYFGLKIGLGYEYYSGNLTLTSISKQISTKDKDGDQVTINETASNIEEKQHFSFADVPVIFLVKIPFNISSGLFFNTGVDFLINLSNGYSNSGTYSVTATYPAYNVTVQNQPDYGLYSNQTLNSSGSLKVNEITENIVLSPGYYLKSGNSCFEIGILFKLWLTKYSLPYSSPYDINTAKFSEGSLLANSKLWIQASGIQIRYSYFF